MDAAHTLRLKLDSGWWRLYLRCEHGKEMPWHGDYDEYGELLHQDLTDGCWVAEWAGEVGVEGCLELPGQLDDVHLPLPVACWFDGDGLCIAPANSVAP